MSNSLEYKVESILKAKVHQKRRGRLIWHYLVKWEGYDDPDENTWEPKESFDGSEHFIHTFWSQANTGGREFDDASLFRLHEEILLVGSPARKKIKKPKPETVSDSPQSTSRDIETSVSEVESILETRSTKRDTATDTDELSTRVKRPTKTYRKRSGAKAVPGKSRHKDSDSARRSISAPINNKKRKLDIRFHSEEEGNDALDVPLTKIGPPKGVKKRKRKLNGEAGTSQSKQDNAVSMSSWPAASPGYEAEHDSNGKDRLPTDFLFSSPSGRSAPRVSGTFSSLAVDTVSDQGNDSENGSINSKVHVPPTTPPPRIPAHRARKENPRVKMMDEPGFGEGMKEAISVKTKLIGKTDTTTEHSQTNTTTPNAGPAPEAGLSSKKPDDTLEIDDIFEDFIRAPRLLELAGMDQTAATALEDFQDKPMQTETEVTELKEMTEIVVEPKPSDNDPLFSNIGKTMSWPKSFGESSKNSIFGALGIGASTSNSEKDSFPLNLDSSVSVPVVLRDIDPVPSFESPPLESIIPNASKSPPGKFYKPESGAILLNTLKVGGPSARLVLTEAADPIAIQHFDRFQQRLQAGDIFIAIAGPITFVVASSENQEACTTLLVSPVLRGLASGIVVSAVEIENGSAYAEAALLADNHRWL